MACAKPEACRDGFWRRWSRSTVRAQFPCCPSEWRPSQAGRSGSLPVRNTRRLWARAYGRSTRSSASSIAAGTMLGYWLTVADDGPRLEALEATMKRHMDQAIGCARATHFFVFASIAAFLAG